jgi:hypothetical protein
MCSSRGSLDRYICFSPLCKADANFLLVKTDSRTVIPEPPPGQVRESWPYSENLAYREMGNKVLESRLIMGNLWTRVQVLVSGKARRRRVGMKDALNL